MATEFTFRRSQLLTLINNNPDAGNIIITYDDMSETPYVAYTDIAEAGPENLGGSITGCPYPPGCTN